VLQKLSLLCSWSGIPKLLCAVAPVQSSGGTELNGTAGFFPERDGHPIAPAEE